MLSKLPGLVKSIIGILAIAVIISGIMVYLSTRFNPIKYEFAPENHYVYTFHENLYTINYSGEPQKRVTLFNDGFHPLCVLGCYGAARPGEIRDFTTHLPGDKDDRKTDKYVYLRHKDSISIQFHLDAGNRIQDRFPYINKVLVDLNKGDSKRKGLQITAKAYTHAQGKITSGDLEPNTITFSFAQEFNEYSVYALDHPYFIKRITIHHSDQSRERSGIRQLNAYLSRSLYLKKLTNARGLVDQITIDKQGDEKANILENLNSLLTLDPYAPEVNLLKAKVFFETKDYSQALRQIELGIEKQTKYSTFLRRETKLIELQKFRAYAAKELQKWDLAIQSMKKATPDIDRDFLSKVYLRKYIETGENNDFYQALRQALLHYKETPRLALSTLRTFSKKDRFLHKALTTLSQDMLTKREDTVQLKSGEAISTYIVCLTKSLLDYWLHTPDSLRDALGLANESERLAKSKEQEALAKAVKSMIYFSQGANQAATKYKQSAMEFFGQYTKLYTDWQSALQSTTHQ